MTGKRIVRRVESMVAENARLKEELAAYKLAVRRLEEMVGIKHPGPKPRGVVGA